MSSGFVSAGTSEQPFQNNDWVRAQQQIEEARRAKAKEGQQADGKSLYETLQANKAAKQEAFEEAARLKNQFRTLDDDEVEFLDSVLESTRKKEQDVKKETAEQLELFRNQREAAEQAALQEANAPGAPSSTQQESWTTSSKKRRREKQKEIPGLAKLRKTSAAAEGPKPIARSDSKTAVAQDRKLSTQRNQDEASVLASEAQAAKGNSPGRTHQHDKEAHPSTSPSMSTTTNVSGLGLGGYSSDEE